MLEYLHIGALFLLFWSFVLVVNLELTAVLILLQSVFSLSSAYPSNLTLDYDLDLTSLFNLLSIDMINDSVIFPLC